MTGPMTAGIDEAQWAEWYRSLEKPLYNVAYRWVWDAAESQDIVQEAFLRCWRIRARVDPDRFRALIFRTTLRLASNRMRRRRLWRFLPFGEREDNSAESSDGDFLAERALRAALAELAEPLKQVLLLSELGGLSYREISEVMNIREGTVGSRRNRALADLKVRLAEHGVQWNEA